MKILQEVSSVEETSRNNPAGLTTNKRAIETTVTVDDGSIVAIGGLIQEAVSDGENKVPLLGDLPVLGWLFKYQQKQRKKTNLMVFLRPVVLRNGGIGYSRRRGPSKTLPRGSILPCMLPALPETPSSHSTTS